jgi:hypothetical protein
MGGKAAITNSFGKGVLDPGLRERIDLPHYYNSLAAAKNVLVRPQGGCFRRPGTSLVSDHELEALGYRKRLRRKLLPLDVTGAMITTYNGGVAANLTDQNEATAFVTSAVNGSVFVLAEVDLGVAREVCFVDLVDFSCATGRWNGVVACEYWNGSAWTAIAGAADARLGAYYNLRTSARTRRFGAWPGGDRGTPAVARSWRIVLYGAYGAGAITVGALRLWSESSELSPARVFSFAKSADITYQMVLSDRNIDVFQAQRYVASIPVPIDASQIDDIKRVQSLDTLMLFHPDIATRLVTRQGAHNEWHAGKAVWTNVPPLSSGAAASGQQDQVADVTLGSIQPGQSFVLWVEDVVTRPIAFAATGGEAAIATALAAALGIAGIVVTRLPAETPNYRLQFSGAAGGRHWAPVIARALTAGVVTGYSIVQPGLKGTGGLLLEDATGWPGCGAIYQSRLFLGGFRATPQTVIGSVQNLFLGPGRDLRPGNRLR